MATSTIFKSQLDNLFFFELLFYTTIFNFKNIYYATINNSNCRHYAVNTKSQ